MSKVTGQITPSEQERLKYIEDALMSDSLVLEDTAIASTLKSLSQADLDRPQIASPSPSRSEQPHQPKQPDVDTAEMVLELQIPASFLTEENLAKEQVPQLNERNQTEASTQNDQPGEATELHTQERSEVPETSNKEVVMEQQDQSIEGSQVPETNQPDTAQVAEWFNSLLVIFLCLLNLVL